MHVERAEDISDAGAKDKCLCAPGGREGRGSLHNWQTYEQVAAQILNDLAREFGLDSVQSSQRAKGHRSGREWAIDAKGVGRGGTVFVIVEVRQRRTSRLKAEHLAGLAYRIFDTGAVGGIIVSPLPLQEGAKAIAKAENIVEFRLLPDSSPDEFVAHFLNKIVVRLPAEAVGVSVVVLGGALEDVR
jgi:hypothetical protein